MDSPASELEQEIALIENAPPGAQLFRLLRRSELFFLVPHHPELSGGGGIQGMPPMITWKSSNGGRRVVVFTSAERAREAMTKVKIPGKQHAIAAMQGVDVFSAIADSGENLVINPSAGASHHLFLENKDAAAIADGMVLMRGKTQFRSVKPEDYPEHVLAPMREYLPKDRGILAAWLLEAPQPPDDPEPHRYIFGFYGKGTMDRRIRMATAVAVKASQGVYDAIGMAIAGNDPNIAVVFERLPPFYASPDHDQPIPPWPPLK